MGGLSQWTGGAATAISNLSTPINQISGVKITADATRPNNTIDAFLTKVQSQGFVGSIWNLITSGSGSNGGNPIGLPPIPGKAGGGIIEGPGGPKSDNILGLSRLGVPTAAVPPGEFVVNAEQTARNRLLLEAINGGLAGFASGGYVLPRSLTCPVDAGLSPLQREASSPSRRCCR